MKKKIGIIATLDTKYNECEFLKSIIRDNNAEPVIIDIGVKKLNAGNIRADINTSEIYTIAGLRESSHTDKAEALEKIKQALSKAINFIIEKYSLDSLVGIGGVQGTVIIANSYNTIPFGFPCVLVSTVASGERKFNLLVKNKDIIILNTIVDLLGLNEITKKVLENSASIACSLAENKKIWKTQKKKIAITVMGITNKCGEYLYKRLTDSGFEVFSFHATGAGGDAMEKLIRGDFFDGVIDLTTHELSAEALGGFSRGESERLTALSENNIPAVIVPGAAEIFDFYAKGNQSELTDRQYIYHNSELIHARCKEDELKKIAGTMAKRINNIKHCSVLIIPERGFSTNTKVGAKLANRKLDKFFISELGKNLNKDVNVKKYDLHIEDEVFCDHLINSFLCLMEEKQKNDRRNHS